MTFLAPFVDSMVPVDVRETPRTGDRQDVITRDNVSVGSPNSKVLVPCESAGS
jgi:hypothetical protein